MNLETKKFSLVMVISAIAVAAVMMIANSMVLRQVREEAVLQASRQQEASLRLFWDLMSRRGRNFRIEEGNLMIGDYYVLNGNNELPDKIFSITGSRATIFQGDIRIATNVVHPDGSRALGTRLVGPAYRAVIENGLPYRGEALILGVPYYTAYDPIRNEGGEVIGVLFVGVKQDEYLAGYQGINLKIQAINGTLAAVFVLFAFLLLAERKRSEDAIQKQLSFLQVLYDTVPSPIFSRDASGRYSSCNKAFESLVGLPREEIMGKGLHEVWPRELADHYQKMDLELFREPGTQVYESHLRDGDGKLRDVVFNRACLRDEKGEVEGIVGAVLDITERKAAEEEMRKLEAQKHHARMMELLMAQLGHDLRTPLTPLFALIPLIRRKLSDPDLLRMLDICQQSATHIQGLTEKALDLVRLSSEAKKPKVSPLPLAWSAAGVITELGPLFEKRGVSCLNLIHPDSWVMGAEAQLALLFRNLLSNAARYAAQNGKVEIRAELSADAVRVSVQDDGAGLAPEHSTLIFCEFFKADRSRQDLNNQGLGLAICQRIVSNHGGRIWAESPGKGKGCTINFTLPPAPAAGDEAAGVYRRRAREEGPTVAC